METKIIGELFVDQVRNKPDWECQGTNSGNFINVNIVICNFKCQTNIILK